MMVETLAQITAQITALERQVKLLKGRRAARIAGLRRDGKTLQEIADEAKLTRQRVFQICEGAQNAKK